MASRQSDGRVTIDTRIDEQGAVRGMNGLENSLKPTLRRIGALVATAFSVKKLIDFGKQAIDLASDIQEVQNVVDTAFGEMAYKMEEFADSAVDMYGISKLTAKQTGSTFMAMAKGMGLATDSASDMSLALTGLSADMASFYNVRQDVASTALKSIFTGETETLKQFGVVMTETNLQEFAYQQGINKKIQAMTQAEKVQLRYNYVMKQTQLAQGDFAKTSDSWANQTRILSERWKEFLSIAGNGLIQVLAPDIKFVNSLLSRMIEGITYLSKLWGFEISTTSGGGAGIADMVENMDDLTDSTQQATKAQKKLLGTYDDLNVIDKGTSTDTSALAGVGDLESYTANMNATVEETDGLANKFSSSLDKIKESASKLWDEGLSKLGNFVWTGLKDFYNEFLEPLAKWTVGKGLPQLLDIFNDFLNSIDFQKLNDAFKKLWKALEPFAEGIGQGLLNFFKNLMNYVVSPIVGFLIDIVDVLSDWVSKIPPKVMEAMGEALGTFIGAFVLFKGLSAIPALITGAAGALSTLFSLLLANPVAAIAAGIAALVTALVALWDTPEYEPFVVALDSTAQALHDATQEYLDSTKAIEDNLATDLGDIDVKFDAVRKIADDYLTLSQSYDTLSEAQKEQLKTYADMISDNVQDAEKYIDPITGQWQATNDTMLELINNTEQYYKRLAIGSAMQDLYEQQIKGEKQVSDLQEELLNQVDAFEDSLGYITPTQQSMFKKFRKNIKDGVHLAHNLSDAEQAIWESMIRGQVGFGKAEKESIKNSAWGLATLNNAMLNVIKTQEQITNDIEYYNSALSDTSETMNKASESTTNLGNQATNTNTKLTTAKDILAKVGEVGKTAASNVATAFNKMGISDKIANALSIASSKVGDFVTDTNKKLGGVKSVDVKANTSNAETKTNGFKTFLTNTLGSFTSTINANTANAENVTTNKNNGNSLIYKLNNVLGSFRVGLNLTNSTDSLNTWISDIQKSLAGIKVNLSASVSKGVTTIAGVVSNVISKIKVPALASGAVLPANKPFMAMVGDQKHGTNVEAPLDTIVAAMEKALSKQGSTSVPTVIVELNGREIARATAEENEKYKKQNGGIGMFT